jgi:hypothetical protein
MIEVFRTNVNEQHHADRVIRMIHRNFPKYRANFDLTDCDRILRIKSSTGVIDSPAVVDLLKDAGYFAEVLPDEIIVLPLELNALLNA